MKLRKILANPFLWFFIIGVASIHLIKELALARRSAPDPLVFVDEWSLIDQDGRVFSKSHLKGKLFIADFFFTSCPTICPKLTNAMKEVHQRFLGKTDQVHFVSISVDPEIDTPAVLKNFMSQNQINVPNWHCLTGSKREIYSVITEKMRVHVGEKIPDGEFYDVPHLAQLALFDQEGNLRGLFKTEDLELASLVRAANFLLEKK